MNKSDIETFMKAKKEDRLYRLFQALSVISILVLLILNAYDPEHSLTTALLTASVLFSSFAFGANRWVSVSRRDLLDIIQRQINHDSEAIGEISKSTS